jgi:hypothetical protein
MKLNSRLKAAADQLKIAGTMQGKTLTDEACQEMAAKIARKILVLRGVSMVTRLIVFCGLGALVAALMGTDPLKTVVALALLRLMMFGGGLKAYEDAQVVNSVQADMDEFTGVK